MNNLPITVKRSIELMGLIGLLTILTLGSQIFMPLLLAFLLTILLLPVYRFLKRKHFPNFLAVLISLLVLLIMLGLVVWFLSFQLGKLFSDFASIKENILAHMNSLSDWIAQKIHFSARQQITFINKQSEKALNLAAGTLGDVGSSLTGLLLYAGLVPIYIFLMLTYKNLLLHFVFMWFKPDQHFKVRTALRETETIIKSYLGGLMIQISYMIVLVGGVLWLIGIEHAFLIGIIFAFLNLIPYVGALIGIVIGLLLTLSSTQELWPLAAVLGVIAGAQFLDNNILMPRIVGSKVQVNALASICGVIIGGAIGGIPGMFLSLPVMATLKVVFQGTDIFYHWSILLGDTIPKDSPMTPPAEMIEEVTHPSD